MAGDNRLRVEPVRDDVLHFEVSRASSPADPAAIPRSPMIDPDGIAARRATWTHRDDAAGVLETSDLRVEIERPSLCVRVTDLRRGFVLHRVCAADGVATISREKSEDVYGLGEQFVAPGVTDGDWLGRERTPGSAAGNAMVSFDRAPKDKAGSVGNAQFPVLYAAGPARNDYAMVVDDVYPETWSFTGDPWTLHTNAEAPLRWYVASGDLPALRRDVMALLGHAPVPPKKAFGLWISEYGFDDWKELEGKLATLREHHFPVDGFVLDLQWFGGITPKSETSHMGTLRWDETHFPDPVKKLRELRDKAGVGVIPIEESYVSRGLPEYAELARRGLLVRDCATCRPTTFPESTWWGIGGMIDWSNPAAGDYWHDTKRQALIDAGVVGHWCDLGEPETFSPASWYAGTGLAGHRDADVHDLFSFLWVASVARGYERHDVARRPFVMARSGAPGIQRFGASMWSGDIGSNLTSLAAHLNVQMHMAMSGIDYFGADIGGFIREDLRGDLNDTYTQWFADGMALDVPGRVHTSNVANDRETAPDRVGHMASNLASVRRRYELVPYLYSLAHEAWLTGDPVEPPLAWAFEDDEDARRIGGEKMLGDQVLVVATAKDHARTADVYLPRGATWIELDGARRWEGGQRLHEVPLYDAAGVLRLPMFARAGAIVPLAYVDDQTWNVLGKRGDGTRHDELRVRVFTGGAAPSRFTVYEDDGETVAYRKGQVRATDVELAGTTVVIGAARGDYAGAPAKRDAVVEVVLGSEAARVEGVTLDGKPLESHRNPAALAHAASGWTMARAGVALVKTGELPVGSTKTIVVTPK